MTFRLFVASEDANHAGDILRDSGQVRLVGVQASEVVMMIVEAPSEDALRRCLGNYTEPVEGKAVRFKLLDSQPEEIECGAVIR